MTGLCRRRPARGFDARVCARRDVAGTWVSLAGAGRVFDSHVCARGGVAGTWVSLARVGRVFDSHVCARAGVAGTWVSLARVGRVFDSHVCARRGGLVDASAMGPRAPSRRRRCGSRGIRDGRARPPHGAAGAGLDATVTATYAVATWPHGSPTVRRPRGRQFDRARSGWASRLRRTSRPEPRLRAAAGRRGRVGLSVAAARTARHGVAGVPVRRRGVHPAGRARLPAPPPATGARRRAVPLRPRKHGHPTHLAATLLAFASDAKVPVCALVFDGSCD